MCFSCRLLDPIHQTAEQYAIRVFEALAPGALLLFQTFVGGWLVLIIFKLLKASIRWEEIIYPTLTFTLVSSALEGHGLFWQYGYRPFYETAVQLLSALMRAGPAEAQAATLQDLLSVVEGSVWEVIQFATRLQNSSGMFDILPLLAGIVLMFPYLFLLAHFMVFTVEFLFKLLIVSALSPVFIIAAGFKISRGYAVAALKVVLQGFLTLCIAVVLMGMMVHAITAASTGLNLPNGNMGELIRLGEFSLYLCGLFALGVTAVIFQLKSPAISSSIVGGEQGPQFVGMTTEHTARLFKASGRLAAKPFHFFKNRGS
jgi:type IV secretion system protein TrbL